MNIIFIALQLSQPRCIKRIKAVYDAGFNIKVYGFDSGLYNESLKTLPFPVERIIRRDKNQRKLGKIIFIGSCIKQIICDNSKKDLYYLFGYEIASVAWLQGCKHYLYEEADVTAARVKNRLVRSLMLCLDKHIIKQSYRTVLTSGGFVSYIFHRSVPKDKIILLPNKLDPYFDNEKKTKVKASSINVDNIKFGFIGLIRYPNTIVRFAKVVGKFFPKHEFHFWGEQEKAEYLDEEVKGFRNVFIHGRFRNPEDLLNIYAQIDISVVCYDTSSGNVCIAEPNKLYESIYFETPIVVSSGTFLAERVNKLGVGYDIDAGKDRSVVDFIKKITPEEIERIVGIIHSIPYKEVVDDSTELIESLKKYMIS